MGQKPRASEGGGLLGKGGEVEGPGCSGRGAVWTKGPPSSCVLDAGGGGRGLPGGRSAQHFIPLGQDSSPEHISAQIPTVPLGTSGQNPGLCRPETQDGFVQSGIVTKTGLRTAAGALKPSSLARLLPQP